MAIKQQRFLESYLETLSDTQRAEIGNITFEHFCADEYNANECAKLINQNIKRASCSLKAGYDIEGVPLPKAGDLTVVLDWAQNPVCIIRIDKVETSAFNQVSEEFAALEGEGDQTLEWWKNAHMNFFKGYAEHIGAEFTPDSILVLEYFNKVFPLEEVA
ncbi:hypothetical protein JCM19231_5323 [Vibrio ishigakensis]|uniref:ASCH domain-containing protein n=1 Tax=Vibrio ishigakensis TaxID=1481914 RepID=A0A0B8NXW9_9VIBR|nr:ASCH domain-containing protein [Vibrio ishigakensis]GAM55549.1 hypothetical protein JCM19231_5323 [Vibrio ishigakensis]